MADETARKILPMISAMAEQSKFPHSRLIGFSMFLTPDGENAEKNKITGDSVGRNAGLW
jgi:hypothetical protein